MADPSRNETFRNFGQGENRSDKKRDRAKAKLHMVRPCGGLKHTKVYRIYTAHIRPKYVQDGSKRPPRGFFGEMLCPPVGRPPNLLLPDMN